MIIQINNYLLFFFLKAKNAIYTKKHLQKYLDTL